MNMSIYEFMNLCQVDKSIINVVVYEMAYSGSSIKLVELFDNKYLNMPISLRCETIRKWNVETRDYKPYIAFYI